MSSASKLDRYRYISDLGRGGMSHVVLAQDVRLGRKVALKQMNAGGDSDALLRLRREALIGASVSHPNLVSIYDIVASGGGEYVIVMEYVNGKTLREELAGGRRLAPARVLTILDGIAAGLDAIHANGIVHRDVKPGNILLASGGDVKLADLGIASAPDRTRITREGVILGTFSYMSPEQLDGRSPTPATDVYALAAVAYEALSGKKARPETNPVALAHAIATQPPPDLRDAWPDAPAEAAETLIGAMAAKPAARPQSATELMRRLRDALQRPATVPLGPLPRRAPGRTVVAPAASQQPAATHRNAPPARQLGGSAVGPAASTTSSRRGRILALLALLVVAAIVGVLLTSSGQPAKTPAQASSSHHRARSHPARHHSTGAKSATSASAPTGSAAPSTGSAAAATGSSQSTGSTASANTPTSAAESFYSLAASHRYADAWALADPTFRTQLGGYQSFENGQALDRSITFNQASLVTESADSATIAVRTTSVRANGTQHCSGTVDLVRATSTWLLHLIHINCV